MYVQIVQKMALYARWKDFAGRYVDSFEPPTRADVDVYRKSSHNYQSYVFCRCFARNRCRAFITAMLDKLPKFMGTKPQSARWPVHC